MEDNKKLKNIRLENFPYAKVSKEDHGEVNPVYADAIRQMEKTNKIRDKYSKLQKRDMERSKKHEDKLTLDENLFSNLSRRNIRK